MDSTHSKPELSPHIAHGSPGLDGLKDRRGPGPNWMAGPGRTTGGETREESPTVAPRIAQERRLRPSGQKHGFVFGTSPTYIYGIRLRWAAGS